MRLSRPGESAGFDLLDFLDAFGRGVEPNTDVAVTLSCFFSEVFDRRSRFTGALKHLDNLTLQLAARGRFVGLG